MAWQAHNGAHHRTTEYKRLRRQALQHLDYRCAVPGCTTDTALELDHIRNVARGGTDTLDNVQWLCRKHHNDKTQREAAARRGKFRRAAHPSIGAVEQARKNTR